MYTLLSGLYAQWNSKEDYFITILGLDNAGKTTFLECVKEIYHKTQRNQRIAPTVGLNIGKIAFDPSTRLQFWDLGGQKELHSLWEKYYEEAHGIIFIVDSTDKERIEACKQALETVLVNDKIEGLPILMLANKQDLTDAMSIQEIQSIFNKIAESLSARDSKVLAISALTGTGVKEAIEWIGVRMIRNKESRPPLISTS